MKGTYFQAPLEFRLVVEGESWRQADTIRGTLTVKNRGSAPISLDGVAVRLARGRLAKVRQKSAAAFDPIAVVPGPEGATLPALQEVTFPWSFATDQNCPITDNVSSLFLLYGPGDALEKLGQLELPMHPFWLIDEFLGRFAVPYRFVRKSARWSKNWVEAKLAPPDGKTYSMVEHVLVSFHFDEAELQVHYDFHFKKIEATASSVATKKANLEFDQTLRREQLQLPSGRPDHDRMEAAIRETLTLFESR